MTTEEYISLVYRNLKGELSDGEFRQLNVETAMDPERAKLRLDLEDTWDLTGKEQSVTVTRDTERLLSSIISTPRTVAKKKTATVFTLKRFMSSIAAIAVLALGVLWLMNDKVTVYDSPGLYTLADETKVDLRSGSTLTIASFTKDSRSVTLSGEAFFEVTSDATRPFTVSAGQVNVEVLGTSFLVKQTAGDTYVQLIEGKVKTTDTRTNAYYVLTPGTTVLHTAAGNIGEVPSYQNLSSWKEGFYQFQNTTVEQVVRELSLIHNTTIEVTNATLAACNFSGSISGDNIAQLLAILGDKYSAEIQQDSNKWIIRNGQCK